MINRNDSSAAAYHPISKILHWLAALLVFGLLGVGLYMSDLELSPEKLKLYGLHKAFGAILLGLMLVRLGWRFYKRPPALPEAMPHWQRKASQLAHFALYALLFAMPISGWLMSSAAGYPVSVFGWFTLPDLVAANPQMKELYNEAHEICANLLMVLIGLHIAAALKHHFVDKDGVLRRMLPALLIGLFAFSLHAQEPTPKAQPWYVDPSQSTLRFTATQNNSPISGEFRQFGCNIFFDPEKLEDSSILVSIPLVGLRLSNPEAQEALLSPEWLDGKNFPLAAFRSTRITHSAKNNYVAEGVLMIRGANKPAFLHFTLEEFTPTVAKVRGEATLLRNAFGVGQGEWQGTDVVKDEVEVSFSLVAYNSPMRPQ